ncbi:hypothetical protein QTH85_14765 [Clostridium perfringens]|uniref:hypothetical protein n=1 Tax=Clostridium perfringens TaxID=1502 RepID=UPI000E4EF10E|nr:hypothetical protein [Clostridium perfringens]MDM0716519.1 hypothetical protein [Clostridium perfringens]RHN23771.1 hypothetical protein DWZ20_13100 [Clostridium perfringens]
MAKSIRNRTTVADYLKVGEEFVLMGAGFTDINESPNAKTNKKQYVNDKSPTSSIVSYESEFPYETDQIRDEKAIDFICDIGELHKTGSESETEYIRVDLDKPGTADNTFRARKFNVAVQVDDLNAKDGEMTAKGKLLTRGDLVVGTFNITTKEFTEGFTAKGK